MNKIYYNNKARKKLKKGIDTLANAVSVTLGPNGRTVIMNINGIPTITKDGVSVAKEIYLDNPIKNIGAQMVKEVASKTNDIAGDGTTTATVLAQAIITEGFKEIENGEEPIFIKRKLDVDLKKVLNKLEKLSTPIKNDYDKIYQIAYISTNGDDKLATLITDLLKESKDSNIVLDLSKTKDTYFEYIPGMTFRASYIDSWFTNTKNRECIYKDAYILVYNGKMNSAKELLNILDSVLSENKPIVIIAEQVNHDILQTIIINKKKGLESVILNAPGFGPGRQEALNDIAIYTGTEVIQHGSLNNLTINELGKVKKIIVNEDNTILIGGNGDEKEINNRIEDLISVLSKQDKETRKHTEKRISNFKGGIGTIFIGSNTELEYKEKYHRVEDAINSVKASLKEGIISGGGSTLYKISEESDNSLLYRAIKAPYKKIKENGGYKVYDFIDDYNNYLKEGIIDPKKVTRVALENAVSIAGTILTTECVIINN